MIDLRFLRTRRGWSQVELSRRARVHPADYSRIERGLLVPYPKQAKRLARVLGITEGEVGVRSV